MQNRRYLSSGFTFIELTIVIAIISILVVMMVPVLIKAQERARRINCINNLRQVGVAMQIYQTEWNTAPPAQMVERDGYKFDLFGGKPGSDSHFNTEAGFGAQDRPLNHYITLSVESPEARMEVFKCPSDRFTFDLFPDSEYETIGTSYQLNRDGLGGVDGGQLLPLSKVRDASSFVMAGDDGFDETRNNAPVTQTWHGAENDLRYNILFLDGHVRTHSLQRGLPTRELAFLPGGKETARRKQFRIIHYDFDVHLYPQESRLANRAVILVQNTGSQPLETLSFILPQGRRVSGGRIEIKAKAASVGASMNATTFERQGNSVEVSLPEQLPPSQAEVVVLDYEIKAPGDNPRLKVAPHCAAMLLDLKDWFPWFPTAFNADASHLSKTTSTPQDKPLVRLAITVPLGQTVLSTYKSKEVALSTNETASFIFETESPDEYGIGPAFVSFQDMFPFSWKWTHNIRRQ